MDLRHRMDVHKSDSSDTEDFFQELASLNDIGLLRATMQSLECGRLTPLIKEELRCRIQSRRLSEGKQELLVEFPSPTPSQPRPDEVEKRDRRREQNRRAAQKFRKKKKERGEHLIEETQRLEYHNTSLRSEIKQLHEEREQLTQIIHNHSSVCTLTPKHSPLTIPRDSPAPGGIGETSETLPSRRTTNMSPLQGKRPSVAQSPGILAPPSKDSPAPFLIINSEEAPVATSVVASSPVSGRLRKSPVSLLQSPGPVEPSRDRSPIFCGSPAKQAKHSIPPRLTLMGSKPIIPLTPKPTHSSFPGSPSPRTPKSTIASPSQIAPSPASGTRLIQASPVFFSEGGYTPSSHGQHTNPSPQSAPSSSTSSTPATIAQQSPVFFVDRAPKADDSSSNFLQPLSTSSTSSLASLMRQESPLSVLSNSSCISNSSSVFIANNTNHNTCFSGIKETPELSSTLVSTDQPQSVYSSSSQSSFPDNREDNVLSLEEIEKSASGFETRDDLLDFMDIQALLDLSSDHNGNDVGGHCVGGHCIEPGHTFEYHIKNQNENSTHNIHREISNGISTSVSGPGINSERTQSQNVPPTPQQPDQCLFPKPNSQNVCPASSVSADQGSEPMDSVSTSGQCKPFHVLDQNSYQEFDLQRDCQHAGHTNTERDHSCRHSTNSSEPDSLQPQGEHLQGHAPSVAHLHQLHNLLREIILAQNGNIDSADADTIKHFLLSRVAREFDPELSNRTEPIQGSSGCSNHHHVPCNNSDCTVTICTQEHVNLSSTFPLDMLSTSRGSHDYKPDNTQSQKSHQST